MAEKGIKWTDQQLRAIRRRGSDVFVTASAGTGKTAVLSGRCVDLISDKSICPDVWSILVLTFTDMAAEQMRSRIAEQLRAEFIRTRDSHLRQQLVMLQGADISTIHAFCKRLITEYFYRLDLDPAFAVIDADESRLIKSEVLEKTIEWAWRQNNLQEPLSRLLYRRDLRTNDGFIEKIVEISEFLDGVVLRESWYDRASRLTESANLLTSEIGRKQQQLVAARLDEILCRLRYAEKLCKSSIPAENSRFVIRDFKYLIEPVKQFLDLLQAGHWDRCAERIRDFAWPRLKMPKELPPGVDALLKSVQKEALDSFRELSDYAVLNPDYLDRLGASVSSQSRVLIELVRKFDELYSQKKLSLNCLDFADLEHKALRLLTGDESSGEKLSPSDVALVLRRKYRYLFVDEYQDINSVQQSILDRLSAGRNILEVGDVKQSIYAFRGAEPGIFLRHIESATPGAENMPVGLRVDLNVNFRSVKGILDFVNRLFSRIMTASFANVNYDLSAYLTPAPDIRAQQPTTNGKMCPVEFHLLDEAGGETDDETLEESAGHENLNIVTSRQRQAAMIAQRIREMTGADTGKAEFQIYDDRQDRFRDVEYRDIVILMRALAKKAGDYVEVLRLAGVPVSCQSSAGYFQATEINDIVALLKILDNPQRDIELAAVLRSPFFNVSDTELAKIKINSKKCKLEGNFYAQVAAYSDNGSDVKLAGRLREILNQIDLWRTIARRGDLADLIWRIYRQTNFLSFVSALPNGQVRRANLLKLHDRAIQFESFVSSAGIASLTRFVEFIEKLEQTGQDWTPAEPESAAGNAVRILSVHKSKGLEFPVVFLAELESGFNKKDVQADVLTDADYGLALQIIDQRLNRKFSSAGHQVLAERKLAGSLAEEMRILYVATTRAKDRLILTASQKQNRCRDRLCEGFFFGSDPVPDWKLRRCDRPLDWILYALSDQKTMHKAFETGLADQAQDDELFTLKIYGQKEVDRLSKFVLDIRQGRTTDSRFVKRPAIEESPDWKYRFADICLLPAKLSVSELTHRSDEYVKFDYSAALQRKPRAVVESESKETAQEQRAIGTATHLVISHLDFREPVTAQAIKRTVDELLAKGALSGAVAGYIDIESILAFFRSELGKMALNSENELLREWPFTYALPASLVESDASCVVRRARCVGDDTQYAIRSTQYEEIIIVQGIIDMLLRTPKGLVIIDFKTDRITARQVPQRTEFYRQQLELYSRAASAILMSNILGKWLYFLTPGCPVKVA